MHHCTKEPTQQNQWDLCNCFVAKKISIVGAIFDRHTGKSFSAAVWICMPT